MCNQVHPNLVGHTYIADLLIGWMQNRAASMLVDQWLNPGARAAAAGDLAGKKVRPTLATCGPLPSHSRLWLCQECGRACLMFHGF